MPIIPAGLDAGLNALLGNPTALTGKLSPAFDPKHPNGLGYELRMIFRIVPRGGGPVLATHGVLAHVEQYSVQPQVRMAMHATAGGFEVDMPEHDARGLVNITMSGNSGVWPNGRGRGAMDGMAWLRGLQQFFDEWAAPTVCGLPRDQVEMELVLTDAPVSATDPAGDSLFVVVPNQSMPGYNRSARRTAVYGFDLRLLAYKRRHGAAREKLAKKRKNLSFFQKLLALIRKLNQYSFDQMFSRYQQLIAPALQGIAAANDLKLFLTGYIEGASTFIGYNMNLLASTIEIFSSAEQSITDALGLNEGDRFGTDGTLLRGFANMRRELTRSWNALGVHEGIRSHAGASAPDEIGPGSGKQVGAQAPLGAANDGGRLGLWDLDEGASPFHNTEQTGALTATVTAGDTLERLRPAGFTDIDVIRLNRLRWPFIDGSRPRPDDDPMPPPGAQRVLYQGETVLLPSRTAPVSTAVRADVAAVSREDDDERLFGVDLYVNPETRALEWDPQTGDLRLVGGLDNLLQALRHMLIVPVGSLAYAPDLGSYLLAESQGVWATDLQTRLNAIAVRQTLAQDPRVASVDRVTVTTGDGATRVEFDLTAIDGVGRGRLALAT